MRRNTQNIGIAFIDIKDAFPSVDHKILSGKLEHYGVKGSLLSWLTSFVSNRTMYVHQDVDSPRVVATRGVPQGSALGPLLFLIYYNDVVKAVSSQTVLFADDTALIISADSSDGLVPKMNAVLRELKLYFDSNKLLLNVKKTECMFPYSNTESSFTGIVYDSHHLSVVQSFKYLGVYIDDGLSWSVHVRQVISKVKSRLYMMYRSRYCCSLSGRKLLFTAMLQPYFLYCAETWRSCGQTLSGSVDTLYRHCIRIVLNDVTLKPTLSNTVIYQMIDVLPLSVEFQLRCACLMFSIIKLKRHGELGALFHGRATPRATRMSTDDLLLQTPLTRQERDRYAFSWWGCVLWNRIPACIRTSETSTEFCRLYETYLKQSVKRDVNLNRKFYDFL
jgi:hypothetical protein